MSDQREYQDEPNEEGFGGDPTTPQPEPERDPQDAAGEAVAVPASDLTRPIAETMEGMAGDKKD
jgi:hypothetical protein